MRRSKACRDSRNGVESVLWASLRDTVLIAGMTLLIAVFQRARRGRPVEIPSGRTLTLMLVGFAIVWAVTFVACSMGATTSSDDLGGPSSGPKARMPGTLVVATITGMLTFIAMLFAGLLD